MADLFFFVAAIAFLAALHPFTTYPLTLSLVRRLRYRPTPERGSTVPESFALCVCAYNEEAVIGRKAENLIELKDAMPEMEVLVYVDGSTDRTAEILQPYMQDLKIFVADERHGKTHGMNYLVSQTTASVIIFTDANVMIEVESLKALPAYFADPVIGCVCGHLQYTDAGVSATAHNGSLYWRLEEHIKQLESDTGSVMGADGSLFAIRRHLHQAPPDDVIDDMFVSLSILCDQYRIARAPEVIAYEESISSAHDEFNRKIRIACQAFNVHRLLWPRLRNLGTLDLYKYISHKWMRWLTVYWLLLGVVFFETGLVAAGMPALGAALALLSIGFLWMGKKFSLVAQATDILRAFTATGIGVWRSLKGDRFQIWSPATSIRRKRQVDLWLS